MTDSSNRPVPVRLERRRPARGQVTFSAPGNPMPATHLADLDMAGRTRALADLGQPGFRAKQLSRHYFVHHTADPAEMTDLPASVREELVAAMLPTLLTPVRHLSADQGATIKSVWRLHDGAVVESVLMRYARRATVCISSQAGCGMNCPFCATGQEGFTRNLSTAEMVVASFSQYLMRDDLKRGGGYGGFESGLRLAGGKKKPAYDDFRLPLTATRKGSRVKLWGLVRPADGRTSVTVEVKRGRKWKRAGVRRTNKFGAWTLKSGYTRGVKFRVTWRNFKGIAVKPAR